MGVDPYKEDAPVQSHEYTVDSGMCLDCEWDGLLKDAEIEYEWDEFKGNDIPYPTCPECGGGIDNYYRSKELIENDYGIRKEKKESK